MPEAWITNLITRRDAIAAELAAITSSKTNYSADGQSEDHDGHRRALIAELKELNATINEAAPFETIHEGFT